MTTPEPQSKADIVAALDLLRTEGLSFWASLPPERFVTPFGESWSSADNLRHLIRSTIPLAQAFALPGVMLEARFGTPQRPSRSFGALRDDYLERLGVGVDAGDYAPPKVAPPADPATYQRDLLVRSGKVLADLTAAVTRWDEAKLDTYQLPHPLLGDLTLREMLFFTLYHYVHHQQNVARRLAAVGGPTS